MDITIDTNFLVDGKVVTVTLDVDFVTDLDENDEPVLSLWSFRIAKARVGENAVQLSESQKDEIHDKIWKDAASVKGDDNVKESLSFLAKMKLIDNIDLEGSPFFAEHLDSVF